MTTIPRSHRMTPLNHDPAKVRWVLNKSGLSQRELAAQVGCSPSLISEIVGGTRNARQPLLEAIAVALNCPVVMLEASVEQQQGGAA